jgi:RNA polymerase sigma-70 factor (ECF subfamily)
MVAYRLDRRLSARADASDVVQEALADAARRLSAYLRERPIPFYPWLRQLAWQRLVELHRQHIHAQSRSVTREAISRLPLNDESVAELADRLVAVGSAPSARMLRNELRLRVRSILTELAERDREVLVLRHLEQLSTREIAAILGITEGAVKTRHLRALERFKAKIGDRPEEMAP